jgi:hypothetical protein
VYISHSPSAATRFIAAPVSSRHTRVMPLERPSTAYSSPGAIAMSITSRASSVS